MRALAALAAAAGCTAALALQQADGRLAEVVGVWGLGEYRPEEAPQWRPARVSQGLFLNNLVRTGDLSRVAILLRDETQMFVHQNSQIQIKSVRERARLGERPDERNWTRLRLDLGRVWSQSRRVQRSLTMETPTVTMGIRGTDWEVEVDAQGKSTLTVLSGEVDFYNDLGRLTVRRGEQAVAERGKAPVKFLIANPRERVQWVSAYPLNPLRHVYLRDYRLGVLRATLARATSDDADARALRGDLLADLGDWRGAQEAHAAALAAQPGHARALLGLAYGALWGGRTEDAERHLGRIGAGEGGATAELAELARACLEISAGRLHEATLRLRRVIDSSRASQPAAWLMLSDILVFSGELRPAADLAARAGTLFPVDDRIPAQQARILLLADDGAAAAAAAERSLAANPESVEGRLARADQARYLGDARAAREGYRAVTRLKPQDDRGWYGLGAVASEREELAEGRSSLRRAIALNPGAPGYRGELATLETFANNFSAARAEYAAALQSHPSDYLALTGLGLLQLKQGATQDALDSFLRASVIEPRYARAHVFIAVAYYQLRLTRVALQELARASELDDNDPLPYQIASVIHADHLEPARAIEASRQAMRRLPYLKSLNQIANDQKGTANLGSALALFGLEDWAQSFAQNSYYPYWGGSHLFLSDRYPGEFNRKSELYQGYLTDPLAFGASNTFQTLMPRPGHYLSGFLNAGRERGSQYGLGRALVNGYTNAAVPTAYFLEYDYFRQNPRVEQDRTQVELGQWVGAVGSEPSENLGLFVFGKSLEWPMTISAGSGVLETTDSLGRQRRVDLGGRYQLGHASQLWFKLGRGRDEDEWSGSIAFGAPSSGGQFVRFDSTRTKEDWSLRHSFAAAGATEVSWGLERATDDFPLQTVFLDPAFLYTQGSYLEDRQQDESREAFVSLRAQPADRWLLQLDLFHQTYERSSEQVFGSVAGAARTPLLGPAQASAKKSASRPRLGASYRFGGGQLVRAAYQRWTRPAALATLAPTATAGLPLDDWIAEPGGEVKRQVVQLESEWSSRTFTRLTWDRKRVVNLRLDGGLGNLPRFPTVAPPDIERLRNQGLFGAIIVDAPEGQPLFGAGELTQVGAALNQVLSERLTAHLRLQHARSENTGASFAGNPLPYVARRQATAGFTWAGPQRLYLSAQGVHRSARYKDEDLARALDAGWAAAVKLYWETADKRLSSSATLERSADPAVGTVYRFGLGYRL